MVKTSATNQQIFARAGAHISEGDMPTTPSLGQLRIPGVFPTPQSSPLARLFDTSMSSAENTSICELSPTTPSTSPIRPIHELNIGEYTTRSAAPASPTSPVSSLMLKRYLSLPHSIPQDDMAIQIDDCVIDSNKFHFSINPSKIIGRGSYSTVIQSTCVEIDETLFALKIPTSIRTSRLILKEMFSYRIIKNYCISHGISMNDIPVLEVYGLTFVDKSMYHRVRMNETLPCIVASVMSDSLEGLIEKMASSSTSGSLYIGKDNWWRLAGQLLQALSLLRECTIVHMDLKPSNILFDDTTGDFKLCDFTSSGLQQDILLQYEQKFKDGLFFELTPLYCAPELVHSPPAPPSYDTDLYAVGLCLLCAATGERPYDDILKSGSSMIYLNESIKKNKALEFVSYKGMQKLNGDPEAKKLIQMIIGRESLESCLNLLP